MWASCTRPAYMRTSWNVGLATGADDPMPRAMPRTNVVLPAPSSPVSKTRSPRRRRLPKRSPKASVSAGDFVRWSGKVVVSAELHFDRLFVRPHDDHCRVLGEHAKRSQAGASDELLGADAHKLRLFPTAQRVLHGRPVSDRDVGAAENASGAGECAEFLHLAHEPVGDVAATKACHVQAATLIEPRHQMQRTPLAEGEGGGPERAGHGHRPARFRLTSRERTRVGTPDHCDGKPRR